MAKKRAKVSTRQQEEILGILLMALGLLVLISLISHSPTEEPGALKFLKINNAMGVVGAFISYWLIKVLLGYPAIVVPFILSAWGWNRFKSGSIEKMTRITYHSLLAALYIAIMLGLPEAIDSAARVPIYSYSGVIGGFLAQALHHAFGTVGSVIVLLAVGAVALILTLELSLNEIWKHLVAFVQTLVIFLKDQSGSIKNWRFEFPKRGTRKSKNVQPDKEQFKKSAQEDETTDDMPRWKKLSRIANAEQKTEPSATFNSPDLELPPDNLANNKMSNPVAEPQAGSAPPNEIVSNHQEPRKTGNYIFPSVELLSEYTGPEKSQSREELLNNARTLEERLEEFDVQGKVIEINPGPVVTRYEYEPAPGIKVARITALADDLALAMRARRMRIVAPIPGKAAIGIELPNPEPQMVYLKDILQSEEFKNSSSPLTIALGKTISGKVYVTSLDQMPHLLIAGATGAGKSVCINAIIASILYKSHPRDVQFAMIDPKRLELTSYRMLRRHHLTYRDDLNEEVVTNPKNALAILHSLELEMENRYTRLAHVGSRNIAEYNKRIDKSSVPLPGDSEEEGQALKPLPYIVLIIDELADLMMTAAKEIEEPITRLAQMSRAVGIHLIVATQRPSVNVITGVIKANFPARMAFQVASKIDSRTILDANGADKLLGQGDALFLPSGSPEPIRVHGSYVSSEDIERSIEHIRNQPFYQKDLLPVRTESQEDDGYSIHSDGKRDELFHEALKLVVRHQQGSISLLQRRLKIGYSRAARLIDELEAAGVVGSFDGSKAREVLVDDSYLNEMGLV